jgi:hypothetical protein
LELPDVTTAGQKAGNLIQLRSADLIVDVLPANGGRIASIRCVRSGIEFLLGGSDYQAVAQFGTDAPFEESDCAGLDECLPTVSLSGLETKGGGAPDHGDLWRHPWSILQSSPDDLLLATTCFSRPLQFSRRLRVSDAEVLMDYRIENLASESVAFLYACHPLFAVEAGDQLILPQEVQRLRLHYSREGRLTTSAGTISWPLVASDTRHIALNCVGARSDETAEMLYTERLSHGVCALYRARPRQALVMHFDTSLLPYLGLWICAGGWPEGPAKQKQYAVSLEPTVSPHGSLAAAIESGTAPILNAGSGFAFSLRLEVMGIDKPCSYDDVNEYVNQN